MNEFHTATSDKSLKLPDDCPSIEELRITARTMRYMANLLEREESKWPWWKRQVMEYPSRYHYEKCSIKLDTIADRLSRNTDFSKT